MLTLPFKETRPWSTSTVHSSLQYFLWFSSNISMCSEIHFHCIVLELYSYPVFSVQGFLLFLLITRGFILQVLEQVHRRAKKLVNGLENKFMKSNWGSWDCLVWRRVGWGETWGDPRGLFQLECFCDSVNFYSWIIGTFGWWNLQIGQIKRFVFQWYVKLIC